jgi:ubiquinone/menaquinone biosynthesis C-methylase UbiE
MNEIEQKEKEKYLERYNSNNWQSRIARNYGQSYYDLFSFYNKKLAQPKPFDDNSPRFHLQSIPKYNRYKEWKPFKNYFTDKKAIPDHIEDILSLKDKTILDFGCGDGKFCHDAATTYGASLVYGVDIASVEAGKTNKYKSENCKFISAGSQHIPLDDNSVDIVTAFLVLEHVDESQIDKMFKEFYRIANKGFIFSISHGTPNRKNLRKIGKNLEWWYCKMEPLIDDAFLYYPSGDKYKWGRADQSPNIGYSRIICTIKK